MSAYVQCSKSRARGVVNKLSVLFGSLAALFLGLSVFAPPSWYEWIPTKTGGGEVVFPALFTTFLLGFIKETPVLNNFFTERRRMMDERRK